MFQSAPPPSTGWIYVHVYLTAALTAYGCESLAGDALHASTCLPYSHFGSALAVDSLCIRDRLLYTDAALLPFGKQLKTQLSVMGMSLRIWTWSAISLTLKPRVEITLIAASRDSLNPPSCLSGFFPLWQLSGRLRAFLRLQNSLLPHQLAHRNGYVFLIVQKSSLMTFLCTYLLQSWITYKFLTRNAVSRKRLPKRENWESEFLCNIQVFYVVFFVNELTNWSLYAGGWFLSKRRRSSYWIEQSRAFPVWIRVIDLPSHLQQEKMYKTISILSERGQHRRAENRSLYPFMSNQLRYFLFIQALAMILFGSYTHNVLKKSVKNKGRKWEYLGVFSAVGDNSPLSMKLLWLERGPVSHWRLGTSRVNVVSTDLLRKKKRVDVSHPSNRNRQ